MSIDHVIDYDCIPKKLYTPMGLLARLKAKERAERIIKLYRDNGDNRPPKDMGFEMVRRASDGTEQVEVVVVQSLLDQSAALEKLHQHCLHCPANILGKPFGCYHYVNYPITRQAELWLLKQLPTPDQPLLFLLLQQVMQDLSLNTKLLKQIEAMRSNEGVYFETTEVFGKRYDEGMISTNHLFQLLFLPETIQPAYAALLLLLFNAIPRDLDAEQLMKLTPADPMNPPLLQIVDEPEDDGSLYMIKQFLMAVHRAHQLNVSLSLDV